MEETGNYCIKGGIMGSERQMSLFSPHVQALTFQGVETSMGQSQEPSKGPWDGARGFKERTGHGMHDI